MIYFKSPVEANGSLRIYRDRKTVAAGNYSDERKPSQVGTLKQLFSIWFWKKPLSTTKLWLPGIRKYTFSEGYLQWLC